MSGEAFAGLTPGKSWSSQNASLNLEANDLTALRKAKADAFAVQTLIVERLDRSADEVLRKFGQ